MEPAGGPEAGRWRWAEEGRTGAAGGAHACAEAQARAKHPRAQSTRARKACTQTGTNKHAHRFALAHARCRMRTGASARREESGRDGVETEAGTDGRVDGADGWAGGSERE